jgi:hypothetical protein
MTKASMALDGLAEKGLYSDVLRCAGERMTRESIARVIAHANV